MNLSCLTSLISNWDRCSARDPNATYIDELPGFEPELLRDLTTGTKLTEDEVLQNAMNRAARKVYNDIYSHLNGRVSVTSIVENARVGYYGEIRNGLDSSAYDIKGVGIFYDGNAGLNVNIKSISLAARQTGNVTVTIRDAYNPATILATYTIAAVADSVITLPVSFQSTSILSRWGVLITVAGGIATLESKSNRHAKCSRCPDAEPICLDGYTTVVGIVWRSGGRLNNRLDTGGLSVDYAIECDLGQYVCRSAKLFTDTILYGTGAEIMSEAINSRRLNTSTLLDRERLESLRSELADMYGTALKSILHNWKVPNDVCFCTQPLVTSRNIIP
jgi:hypothetical protein